MELNTIIVLMSLVYGVFLGYCLGRYQGYKNGADEARKIYRK